MMGNSTAKKFLGVFFAFALVAGCASTDVDDSSTSTSGSDAEPGYGSEAWEDRYGALERDEQDADQELQYVFYFDFDRAELSPEIRAELDKHIANLLRNDRKVRLEGHADERGTREYNMALGERRANSVANYLVINGVARNRLETVSYGEERPVAFSHDAEAWAKNRRVELKLH